jgi:hypothetical protein
MARSRGLGAGLVRRAQIVHHAVEEGLSAPEVAARMGEGGSRWIRLHPQTGGIEQLQLRRWPRQGQITRLKMLKRQAYGRAHLDLLRRRVLLAA